MADHQKCIIMVTFSLFFFTEPFFFCLILLADKERCDVLAGTYDLLEFQVR